MKPWIISIRIALIAIAISLAEISIEYHRKRIKRLSRKESDLRTEHYRASPVYRRIIYPE